MSYFKMKLRIFPNTGNCYDAFITVSGTSTEELEQSVENWIEDNTKNVAFYEILEDEEIEESEEE